MNLLAIETATEACSVALLHGDALIDRTALAPRRQAELALALILLCVFFAFYAYQVAHGVMIFWLTIMLALLYAARDERVLSDAWDLGLPACHAGHCEWIDTNWRPPMTFGWAWLTDRDRTCRMFPNSVTSNVMIVCARGYDVGPDHTRSLLADWINTLPWTVSVRAHLALPVL